ncbi:MAG: recombinase family protein [Armatimonadetes bacterium]|nr:recombinase family protein [Armatimonadota bacterium]
MKNNHNVGPLQYGDPRNALLRVAIYVRKSTATEGRSHSREEQLERCLADAKHLGLVAGNIDVYEEPEGQKGDWYWNDGSSRFNEPHRPELTRLMQAVEAGAVDIVMAYKGDRLYRDNGVADAMFKRFRELGVRLILGGRDAEVHSARGLYQAAVDGAAARQWRDQISEDIRRDHLYKAKRGMFTRDPSCLGFRSQGLKSQAVLPVEPELAVVRRVFKMFVSGEDGSGPMGITAIANRLMDEGVQIAVGAKRHKVKHPEKVHTSQIRTILRNCMYVGRWRHQGEEYPCDKLLVAGATGEEMETVVPVPMFEEAQSKLARSRVPGRKSLGAAHLLTGIVVCGQCGRPLTLQHRTRSDGTSRRQFICAHKRGSRPCDRRGTRVVQEEVLDAWVLEHLLPLIAVEIERVKASSGRDDVLAMRTELVRQLASYRDRETVELARLIGALDDDQLAGVAAKLRLERSLIEAKLADVETRLAVTSTPSSEEFRDLASLPTAALKDAVRRAFLWIALCQRGVVAMTTWGTSTAAYYLEPGHAVYRTVETRRRLQPPGPLATLDSLAWFVEGQEFVRGQREYQPHRTQALEDTEVLHALWRKCA